jgi:hypothetical protein
MPESSGSDMCPEAQSTPPTRRGLRCHHVPHGIEHTTQQERAPVSPRARGTKRATRRERSPVLPRARSTEPVTRHERAPESPRASQLQARPMRRKALTLPRDRGTRTTAPQGSGIATCPVAPDTPSGAEGLQSRHVPSGPQPQACPCIPKMPDIRLIVASPDMRCRQRIKCVCDRPYAAYGWH